MAELKAECEKKIMSEQEMDRFIREFLEDTGEDNPLPETVELAEGEVCWSVTLIFVKLYDTYKCWFFL